MVYTQQKKNKKLKMIYQLSQSTHNLPFAVSAWKIEKHSNTKFTSNLGLLIAFPSLRMLIIYSSSDVKNTSYFKEEILEHVRTHGPKLINTIENWIKMSKKELTEDEKLVPGYPLLPLSKGFCLSIIKALKDYKEVLISMNIMFK